MLAWGDHFAICNEHKRKKNRLDNLASEWATTLEGVATYRESPRLLGQNERNILHGVFASSTNSKQPAEPRR